MNKIKFLILSIVVLTFTLNLVGFGASQDVYAYCPIQPQTKTCVPGTENQGLPPENFQVGDGCDDASSSTECLQQSEFIKRLQQIVNFLSAGVGILVVIMIMVGGIKYIAAGENPSAVQDAKNTIRNAIFALLAFSLSFAFINWLIPGGVFA